METRPPFSPAHAAIESIFAAVKTIAVVGLSDNPQRASNEVFAFLLHRGFDCVGVNPGLAGQMIHGAPVVASLAKIAHPIDMVDVFRASEALPGLVDEIVALAPRPKVLWTQLGVFDEAAGRKAQAAGLTVVMNRCPKIELAR